MCQRKKEISSKYSTKIQKFVFFLTLRKMSSYWRCGRRWITCCVRADTPYKYKPTILYYNVFETHTHTQTHIDDDVTTLLLAITASIKVAPDSKGICRAMLISVSKVLSQQWVKAQMISYITAGWPCDKSAINCLLITQQSRAKVKTSQRANKYACF